MNRAGGDLIWGGTQFIPGPDFYPEKKMNHCVNDVGPACATPASNNPLSPHDASMENNRISWNLVILKRTFSWKCLKNNSIFFHLSPTLSHFHPLLVENCGSNSRLVVDENDNGKFRLQRVNHTRGNVSCLLGSWPISCISVLKYFSINYGDQYFFNLKSS